MGPSRISAPRARTTLRQYLGTAGLCASSVMGTAVHADNSAVAATDDDGDENLPEVQVTGVRSLLRDKLGDTALNTPQSATVVSSELIASQGATRLEDALRNVPGITLNAGEGAARGDTVNIRGFSAFNDFFIDGIRDAAVYTRDIFDADSVEVLEGPPPCCSAAAPQGAQSTRSRKAPLLTPLEQLTSIIGTNDLIRTTGDFDIPFRQRRGVAPERNGRIIGWRRAAIFVKKPSLGCCASAGPLASASRTRSRSPTCISRRIMFRTAASPSWTAPRHPCSAATTTAWSVTVNTTEDDIATARYKHDFTSNISIADTLRYANYEFDYQSAMPNFGTTIPTATTPLNDILVGRDLPGSSGVQTN